MAEATGLVRALPTGKIHPPGQALCDQKIAYPVCRVHFSPDNYYA